MEIDRCVFPDNLLYDIDHLIWVKASQDHEMLIGITPILTHISGKLLRIKVKEVGTYIDKEKSFASIESLKYFGTIKIPFSGIIIDKNNTLISKPKIVNDSPYGEGWIIKLKPDSYSNNKGKLMSISEAKCHFEKLISRFNVKC
ncbi:MAG: glycine cleavage system protein H [Thermoproteota archaeon]|nr:glycine cleavage system protein H [Thermoproteota archaeon]